MGTCVSSMGKCFGMRSKKPSKGREITSKDLISFKYSPISEHYDIEPNPIGTSSISQVKKATHKATKQIRAVKIINKKKIDEEKLRKEIQMIKHLDHPNILKIYDVFYDTENFYIVSELCTGKELFEHIQKQATITEEMAAKIMKGLLSAISCIHRNNYAHRNIKPESLRFDRDAPEAIIKITNFTNAEAISDYEPFKELLGTPEYLAPEMIDGLYNNSVDLWACGITLYIMMCGQAPFTGKSRQEVFDSIKNKPLEFKENVWSQVSNECKDLIQKLLAKGLAERVTADQALQHAWFRMKLAEQKIDENNVKETLERLKNFRVEKKVQSAILTFMAHYVATKEEKDKLLNVFQALDTNNDGQVSKAELKEGFNKFLLKTVNIDEIFAELDKNQSENIEYSEFVTMMMDKNVVRSQANLKAAFDLLDKDHSGKISAEELREAFGAEVVLFDDAYWRELLAEADKDGDGFIGFQEFVDIMAQVKV